jgi:hypothetical protein
MKGYELRRMMRTWYRLPPKARECVYAAVVSGTLTAFCWWLAGW